MAAPPIFRSEVQARLLALLLLNPERTWQTGELAERTGSTLPTVHRELHRALDAGIVVRDGIGQTYLYRAATESPLYESLRELLEKTVGVEEELRKVLRDVEGIEAAFIHGSFAHGARVGPTSDVDVVVLGDVDPTQVRKRLREVERRIGREIDVVTYRRDEFEQLARAGNAFVRGIARGPVIALAGKPDDLPKVA